MRYEQHENLCQVKLDLVKNISENKARLEEAKHLCNYVDCNYKQSRTMCPEQCFGSTFLTDIGYIVDYIYIYIYYYLSILLVTQ